MPLLKIVVKKMNENVEEEILTLRELKKISKILMIANASIIEKELSKLATSDARKKIWVLIDGKRMPKDLAKETGVTQMAVSYFLNAAAAAEFIEYAQREPPRKILDYVPPSWIDLLTKECVEVDEQKNREGNNNSEDSNNSGEEK